MCRLACFMPADGRKLDKLTSTLDEFNKQQGGHGIGVALFSANEVQIYKSLKFSPEASAKLIVERPADSVAFWHCRLASAGEQTDENCHPFYVSRPISPSRSHECVMIHNGTLSGWQTIAGFMRLKVRTDSHLLAQAVIESGKTAICNALTWGAIVLAERVVSFERERASPWRFYALRVGNGDLIALDGGGVASRVGNLPEGNFGDVEGDIWHRLRPGKKVPKRPVVMSPSNGTHSQYQSYYDYWCREPDGSWTSKQHSRTPLSLAPSSVTVMLEDNVGMQREMIVSLEDNDTSIGIEIDDFLVHEERGKPKRLRKMMKRIKNLTPAERWVYLRKVIGAFRTPEEVTNGD